MFYDLKTFLFYDLKTFNIAQFITISINIDIFENVRLRGLVSKCSLILALLSFCRQISNKVSLKYKRDVELLGSIVLSVNQWNYSDKGSPVGILFSDLVLCEKLTYY